VQWDQKPTLTTQEVDDLLLMADSGGTYTGADLNAAAAQGWRMKAGKVAGNYTQSLGDGVKFNREQVLTNCREMADDYASGKASVLGKMRRRSGIGVVGLVSTMVDPAEVG